MSISAGFTTEEIREFVNEYEVQRYGQKGAWLAGRGVSYEQLRRWRAAVFEGDLDRGLIPREGSPVTVSPERAPRWRGPARVNALLTRRRSPG